MSQQPTVRNNFNLVAPIYDSLSQLYSGGQIRATKLFELTEIGPRDKVLYAGVGGGEDALMCAEKTPYVSVVELSGEMLFLVEKKFQEKGHLSRPELIHGDIFEHNRFCYYDVVVANFFLNVFDEKTMEKLLSHLISLVKIGGKLIIADFAPPSGSIPHRLFQESYFMLALLFFMVTSGNSFHTLYNYGPLLKKNGLQIKEEKLFPLGGKWGPHCFKVWVARRP